MTTNIRPLCNGGPEDDEGPVRFPVQRRTSVTDHCDVTRFLESNRKPTPQSIIKGAGKTNILEAAEGRTNKKKAKVKKGKEAKNLAKEAKKKKRGSFGEVYEAVSAPKKGERVKESNRFRESVSSNDMRDMLQKALREKFPPPKPSEGPISSCGPYGETPWIQDVFPEEHMVVYKMKDVLWASDYSISSNEGKAKLSNFRRVETKYVDIGDDSDLDDSESDRSESGLTA